MKNRPLSTSNWGEDAATNRRLFTAGTGVGDSAIGCNAVANILNSITKEFKEKMQHCSLSVISVPKDN